MSELHWWLVLAFFFGVGFGGLVFNELGFRWWRRNMADLQASDRKLQDDLAKLNQDICSACKEVCS